MFKSIDREEMHVHVEREFESLNKRLELEKATEKEDSLLWFKELFKCYFFVLDSQQIELLRNWGTFKINYILPKLLESYNKSFSQSFLVLSYT